MTLIDDTCDGCGGRFDPMGDPLLRRHPEISQWAVYCGSCEDKARLAREDKALNKLLAKAWDEGHAACDRDWKLTFDITTPNEERQPLTNPYREN